MGRRIGSLRFAAFWGGGVLGTRGKRVEIFPCMVVGLMRMGSVYLDHGRWDCLLPMHDIWFRLHRVPRTLSRSSLCSVLTNCLSCPARYYVEMSSWYNIHTRMSAISDTEMVPRPCNWEFISSSSAYLTILRSAQYSAQYSARSLVTTYNLS